jgi:hypothetical protein
MTVEGAHELGLRFKAVEKSTTGLPRTLGLAVVAEAKRIVPRKTGNLGRRIVVESASRETVVVRAKAPYAAAVEFGTRPHIIRPRRARALRFPAAGSQTTLGGRVKKGKGSYAFARFVRHPGTRAQPYLIPGARAALSKHGFGNVIVSAWNEAA